MGETEGQADQGQQARTLALRVYIWLLFSPVVTVSWLSLLLARHYQTGSSSSPLGWVVALPAIAHVVLFPGLLSSTLYMRRHAQQAFLLVVLRTLNALLFLGLAPPSSEWMCLWFLAGTGLWLMGTIWGIQQTGSGDCWLMRVRGEAALLPRPWALAAPAGPATVSTVSTVSTTSTVPTAPQAAFDRGLALLGQGKREEAVASFMIAFRQGDSDLRRRALAELEKLGEVERG
jgi:hypothetical protein